MFIPAEAPRGLSDTLTMSRRGHVRHAVLVAGGNVAVFALLCLLLEVGYRVHQDGLRETFRRLSTGAPTPYSSIGTGEWVIYDPELGYRLNPAKEGINEFSVRDADRLVVPKPEGLFRILVLGDSIPWDLDGFVDTLSQQMKRRGSIEVINAAVPGYTSYQELSFFKRYLLPLTPDPSSGATASTTITSSCTVSMNRRAC